MVGLPLKDLAGILKYIKGRKSFDRVLEKVKIISFGDGKCTAELKIDDDHIDPMGTLHGGFSTTIVDCISGYALMSKVPGQHVSVDIHMSYIKEARKGDEIVIYGYVDRIGKNMAFLGAQIKNKATGDVLIEGTHTRYIPNAKRYQ